MSYEEETREVTEEGPRRHRRGPIIGLAVAALVILALVDPFGLHPGDEWVLHRLGFHSKEAALDDGRLWTCGMHPQVIQEEPGQCPICHMDLVPLEVGAEPSSGDPEAVDKWTCRDHPSIVEDVPGECPIDGRALVAVAAPVAATATGAAASGEREILFYRNPMTPTVTSPVPAKDEMGMDYVPVYADEARAAVAGGTVVNIDPGVVQSMNVLTEVVERRDLTRKIRTVGYLDYDQGKMVTVTTKYPGFIERVYVNYVGEPVRRGQPMFTIYSPELVQTQQELLSAIRFAGRLEGAPGDARERARGLVAAARSRLAYWDVGAAQVARLEETGEVLRALTVTSPASGLVMQRLAGLEGMAVQPGQELFHIADLSTLWLGVEVFEDQLPWLAEGSRAEIQLSYFPGETFEGRVRFVEPQVAEQTRTVGLRLEVPNRGGRLRSGMYATVIFAPSVARDAVAVPALAILRTGERDLVVVALGEGRFAPREVVLGAEGERYVEVLSGLEAGERVVTSAQFLIDSESNLREAIQKLLAARRSGAAGQGGGREGAGHAH